VVVGEDARELLGDSAEFEDGRFVAAFRDKGRFAELMATIPVHLALEPRAALLGAAAVARTLRGARSRPRRASGRR